jgi:hypothetical protein
MGWKWVIPSFRFEPGKLKGLAVQLAAEIPDGDGPLEEPVEGLDLEGILNVLRSIDEADVEREAARFSTRDVDQICYGFPQIRDSDPAKPKAARLLLHRWKTRYARSVWKHFQSSYADRYLPVLVARGLSEGNLVHEPEAAATLLAAMTSENPVAYIGIIFAISLSPFADLLDLYEISSDSPLALELLRQYFLLEYPEMYKARETSEFIHSSLDEFWHRWKDDYRRVIDNYLHLLDEFDDNDVVLVHALEHLRRPDEPDGRRLWEGISEESQRKFMKWLDWRTVVDFFDRLAYDSERLAFWRMFKDGLEYVRVRNAGNTKAIFLVFPQVAVIEFLDINNAAYIYPRHVYEQRFARHASGRRSITYPPSLKDRDACVLWIHHSREWQARYYHEVARLVR